MVGATQGHPWRLSAQGEQLSPGKGQSVAAPPPGLFAWGDFSPPNPPAMEDSLQPCPGQRHAELHGGAGFTVGNATATIYRQHMGCVGTAPCLGCAACHGLILF